MVHGRRHQGEIRVAVGRETGGRLSDPGIRFDDADEDLGSGCDQPADVVTIGRAALHHHGL